MKRTWFALAVTAASSALLFTAACGDDEVFSAAPDAGNEGGPGPNPQTPPPPPPPGADAGPAACLSSASVKRRLLLTMTSIGGGTESELAAIALDTHSVDGLLRYKSAFGTTWGSGDPFVLEQRGDIVGRLDPAAPWKLVSSWSVAGDDRKDGGLSYAEPAAIAEPRCGLAYVPRFNRNKVAVLDTSQIADGGAPTKYIDLAAMVQAGDEDGNVEATGAIYVPAHDRVYLLLGNVDIKKVATDGFTALCATTKPSIVGIDPKTDAVVSLGGSGPGGSILLDGYNPVIGASFVYDAALDRLLVLEGGCNQDDGDGGAGAIARRVIEEVSLATGQVKTLLTIDPQLFPLALAWGDGTKAVVSLADQTTFEGRAFFWDPRTPSLGAQIPGRIDGVAYDGTSGFVGARVATVDGGQGIEVVTIPAGDAGADAAALPVVSTNPFSENGGFLGGAEVWPH